MGLNFGNGSNMKSNETTKKEEIMEVKEFDIVLEKEQLTNTLVNSEEVDAIVSQIDITDTGALATFGAEVAENISRASDVILKSMSMEQIDKSSKMLVALNEIMNKFDIDEIKEEKGFLNKLFGNAKKQLEKILQKYHTMGDEVDKIYVELKQYESEIKVSNKHLQTMFEANIGYFQELEKYILAGEQGISEIDAYILTRQADYESTFDNNIQIELSGLEEAKILLEQRTQDLRIAENVAMQSVPMIKTMQFSNMNLVRKINSAFIITLPVFKQALAQAILLKRQKIQADAMSTLDEKTNELLLKNAQNTVAQSKLTTQLTSTSSVKIETLESTWQTICSGITETQQLQESARAKRLEDQQRLNAIKEDFKSKLGAN